MTAVRVVAWIAVALALGFFAVAEVGVGERRFFVLDLSRSSRVASALGPPSRVAAPDPLSYSVVVVGEPAYFDVVLPALAEYADVFVTYSKDDVLPEPKFGIMREGESFVLHELKPVSQADGWTSAHVSLDLRGIPRRDGAYRMFFSLPGVDAARPLAIVAVAISARRPTLEFKFMRAVAGMSARLRGL